MASLRRNRTMPTDGATAKFLYTILKQLDLKSIDWQEVADGLNITNGHAARMRFSRFKQQMEGTVSLPRKPKSAPSRTKKMKPINSPSPTAAPLVAHTGTQQEPDTNGDHFVKGEPGIQGGNIFKSEPIVKAEPAPEDDFMQDVKPEADAEPTVKEETTEDEWLCTNRKSANHTATPRPSPELYQQVSDAPLLADKPGHQLSPKPIVTEKDIEKPHISIVKRESTWEI